MQSMTATRAVTLRLPAEDFARLEAEARRAGVRPGTLARLLLRRCLEPPGRLPQTALDRLGALRAELPRVDAVEVLRAARSDLEARQGD